MKLKFHLWYESKHFSDNVNYLFDSAISCYKAEVYTAALLMSYLGFLTELKERVMKAQRPALLPEHKWNLLITNLKDENKWEAAIFDGVMKKERTDSSGSKTEDPIFVINDSIRTQISYWRDRRNDCVHYKDNSITNAHVESFWSFLESNLQKITIEGGKANLLLKFKKHYDPDFTSADEDVMPLIKEIKGTVEKSELNDFWHSMFSTTVKTYFDDKSIEVIKGVISLKDDDIVLSIISYLKENEMLLLKYLSVDASILLRLGYNKAEIRNLWHNKIINSQNPIKIYAALLRNGLIPLTEVKEANDKISSLLKYTDDAEDHAVLSANSFGRSLESELFAVHRITDFYSYWKFMNENYTCFRQYIEYYPLGKDVVQVLCKEFNHDSFYSFFLRDSLKKLFERNPNKKAELEQILKEYNWGFPKHLMVDAG